MVCTRLMVSTNLFPKHFDFISPLGIVVTENNLDSSDEEFKPPTLTIMGRVKHVKPIQRDDFLYLQKLSRNAVPKVCIPSPTMAHFRGGRAAISEKVYPEVIAPFCLKIQPGSRSIYCVISSTTSSPT